MLLDSGSTPDRSTRQCSVCGVVKPLEHFTKDRRRASGYAGKCQQCKNAQRYDYYRRPKDVPQRASGPLTPVEHERRPHGALDAFCGAGGASVGYHRAGFEVHGVDAMPQPHYPFGFTQGDALEHIAERWWQYEAIFASPPCQHYSLATRGRGNPDDHPDLLHETIDLLEATGLPYVVETVPGAPFQPTVVLCGSQFGLRVRRHRYFITNWPVKSPPPCQHRADDFSFDHTNERAYADAMGCTWMTNMEARQAIPPAYTEWLGCQLKDVDDGDVDDVGVSHADRGEEE